MSNTPMTRSDILEAARVAVTADRAATHGAPENTFGLIAQLWSARLGLAISPAQVTILLIDLKTARAWGNLSHMDNWVDMAGYAACGGELAIVNAAQTSIEGYFTDLDAKGVQDVAGDIQDEGLAAEIAALKSRAAILAQRADTRLENAMAKLEAAVAATKPKAGGETQTASMDEMKAMIARGEVKPPSPDASEYDMPDGFGEKPAVVPADQPPVAVVDRADDGTEEAPVPNTEATPKKAKWTQEMDRTLIGSVAAKVANGMSRREAAHAAAHEMGLSEKACEVRAARELADSIAKAIAAATAAKDAAADLATVMAPAKAEEEPKPAPSPPPPPKPPALPLSKRLSSPPHDVLNIDQHLNGCRAKDWAFADDLHLFEMVVEQGYGMGDVAVDMGRDSKAIKSRYDLLTGSYQDANGKWCRKYDRGDVLAALRKIMATGAKGQRHG